MKLIVAGTGASGMPYLIRALDYLKLRRELEVYLILSRAAVLVLNKEIGISEEEVADKPTKYYREEDIYAPIASGSFNVDGMIVLPCSTKTLSAISNGFSDNLITRAAEVTLKERRRLILVVRETPLSLADIENMKNVTLAGAIVMPASPAFYGRPKTMEDLIDFVVGRALSLLGVKNELYREYEG